MRGGSIFGLSSTRHSPFSRRQEVFGPHGLEDIGEIVDEVVFANRSPDCIQTALVECLGYSLELILALLGEFGFDDGVESFLDILGRIGVDVDRCILKMGEAVVGSGVGRGLGLGSFRGHV